MMRSLWTGASGMIAQQNNVDLISNNLANVNTFAFKKERMEFKTLLYQTMKRADRDPALQTGTPVNLQVGLGVRPIASTRFFETGNVQVTSGKLDFALQGSGFFMIERGRGGEDGRGIAYTRDGSFKMSVNDDGTTALVTSDGYHVLDTAGERIVFEDGVMMGDISVDYEGNIFIIDVNGMPQALDIQIAVGQFRNPQGLEAIGSNLYTETTASGTYLLETENENLTRTDVLQGTIEMSNVQVAEEMVRLIVAQRAYELNSKVITTSDDMLSQANNLKR